MGSGGSGNNVGNTVGSRDDGMPDAGSGSERKPTYTPSPKHDPMRGWGTPNPVKSQEEGQRLLDTGCKDGKQIYNVTDDGTIVKFQPDGSPGNGYHSYEVSKASDIPASALRQMVADGKISKSAASKARRGKF